MLSERLLKRFVSAIEIASPVESRVPTEVAAGPLPEDYERFLSAVTGFRAVRDLRLNSPADWVVEKAHWDKLAAEYQAGGGNFSHALWSPMWLPLADDNSHLQFAYAPEECFGGPAGQVVAFDFKGGEDWQVFPSLDDWLEAMLAVLDLVPPRDLATGCVFWATERKAAAVIPLPKEEQARRAPERFHAGDSPWVELRHADGSAWAIRARRSTYQLRIGDLEDPLYRERSCLNPTEEVTRLIAEQEAEGFRRVGAAG